MFGLQLNQVLPVNTTWGTINDEQDIETWLSKADKYYALDYCYFIGYAPFVYTPEVKEYITRYNLLKNHGIKSYSEFFEDLPAKWIDVLDFMEQEISEAMKEKQRQDKMKNG